jgi:hypothetical protein
MKPQMLGFVSMALLMIPVSTQAATTCPNGSYDQYLSGLVCTSDSEMFSQFAFVGSATGGATQPTAAGNSVSVLDVPGGSGFTFSPGMLTTIGQSQHETLSFEVTG